MFRQHAFVIILLLVALGLFPLILITRARAVSADRTRIHLVQDMDNQPRFKEQSYNPLFADRRAMRPRVPGTVRTEQILDNELLTTGKVNGEFSNEFPIQITDSVLKRGQERFDIYCAVCHGMGGYGDGMVAMRAEQLQEGTWTPPLSYHSEQVLQRPNGHLYNTVANGIRNMPAYGPQIDVQDRWAIVAYIRALQLSQASQLQDVPSEVQEELNRSN